MEAVKVYRNGIRALQAWFDLLSPDSFLPLLVQFDHLSFGPIGFHVVRLPEGVWIGNRKPLASRSSSGREGGSDPREKRGWNAVPFPGGQMNRRLVIIMGLAIASIGSCSETGKGEMRLRRSSHRQGPESGG